LLAAMPSAAKKRSPSPSPSPSSRRRAAQQAPSAVSWVTLLKASRPGWWLVTFWMYILPTAQQAAVFSTWRFWLGLLYCTLPLNMLVYVWNDFADYEYDRKNFRKDSYLYGAKASRADLARLLSWTFWMQLPCALILTLVDVVGDDAPAGLAALRVPAWFALCGFGVNGLYNHPLPRLSERPPFDLLAPAGYLGVGLLSAWLNRAPALSHFFWFYNLFLVLQTQVWAQLVDIHVDEEAGRTTSAVRLGVTRTRLLLGAVLAAESAYVWMNSTDTCLRAFTGMAVALPVISAAVPKVRVTEEARVFVFRLCPTLPMVPASLCSTAYVCGVLGRARAVRRWLRSCTF
jgi:4-hydroxybenzoate polyprenyltransferase